MQVTVSGKQIDVGAALQEYVEVDLIGTVTKYFEHAVSADVVFSKSRYLFKADIIVNEGTGIHTIIKANAEDADVYAAYDQASDKIKKRLSRYKERIRNHHKERLKETMVEAKQYVLSSKEEHHESDPERQSPLIIAENHTELESLTVSDAVMRMDLGELPALLFINKRNGNINLVYRRLDGNISWIDPGKSAKVAA
jgi:ribosomal subunit interface protein